MVDVHFEVDAATRVAPVDSATVGNRTKEFISEVVSVEQVMGDAMLLTATAPLAMVRQLRAGRFFDILCRVEGSSDPLLRRPYSVFRIDAAAGLLTFLVRGFGRGSSWLAGRRPGDRLDLLGPLGNTYEIAPRSRNLLMVAGGVGVAPLVMLTDEAVAAGMNITFLMGAANATGLLPSSLLPEAVEYLVATDDGSKGHRGFVTDLVADYVLWADQILSCGPEPMYRSLRQAVLSRRIGNRPPVSLSMEREMACGVGACLGCVVETKRGMQTSCVQGPVFDMDDLAW